MSARSILSVAGQVVGGYFFGPVGAAVGGALGGAIGGAIDGPVESFGPQQDLRAPKITYGGTIPRVYGRQRVSGFFAWCSNKIETAHEEEQGKGPAAVSTTYTYSVNCLLILAERTEATVGQIIGITRVWRNGELIYTALADSDEDSLAASASTDAWTSLNFFDGNPSQLPWPIYEAAVGTDDAIAYRHRATVGIEGLQLGNSAQLPLLEFEVVTAGTDDGGPALTILQSYFDVNADDISAYDRGAPTQVGGGYVSVSESTLRFAKAVDEGDGEVSAYWDQEGLEPDGGALTLEFFTSESLVPNVAYTQVATYRPSSGVPGDHYSIGYYGDGGQIVYDNGGPFGEEYLSPLGFIGRTHIALVWAASGHRVYFNGQKVFEDLDGQLGPGAGAGKLRFGGNATVEGYNFSVDSFRLRREEVYTGDSFTPPDEIPPPDGFTSIITPDTVDLADVVSAEWLRCGTLTADTIDVSDLEGVEVLGVGAGGPAAEVTGRLGAAYYFDVFCNDKLRAIRRGGSSVASIGFLDTGVAEGQPGEPFTGLTRNNDVEQPAQVAVNYVNLSADYEPGTENSDRLVTASSEVRQVGVNVVFYPADAKGRASTMAQDARVASHTGQFTISDEYVKLDCGDVVTVTDHLANSYRVRILRMGYVGGVLSLDVCLDDPSVLTESGITSDTYTPSISVALLGDTTLVMLDIPLLRDADDTTGEYVATKIEGAGSASRVYKSTDSVTYGSVVTVTDEAVIGVATTALGDWTGGDKFDEMSSVTVDVGDGTLSSSTRNTLLSDATVNAFALGADGRWELGQFRTATLVGSGVYKLTGLLRGRKGTEWATGTHEVGDTFVRLSTSGVRRATLTSDELGHVRYWKGATLGRALSTATAQTQTPMGVSQKPWSPVDLRLATDVATGDKALTWKRRTRLTDRFGGVLGDSVPLGESSESYQVRIYTDDTFSTLVTTYDSTVQSLAYTAAQQTTDFGDVVASPYWGVCQRSAVAGLGYEALSDGSSRGFPTSETTSGGLSGGGSGGGGESSGALPKAVAMDYRTSGAFDATALALHKKYKLSVLGMTATQAAPAGTGYAFVQALKADDATRRVFQYAIASQMFDSDHGAPTYAPIYNALTAGGFWALDAATGRKTKTGVAQGYNAYEVNLAKSGAGEAVADGYKDILFDNLLAAGIDGFFQDNTWLNPGGYTSAATKSYVGDTGTVLSSGTGTVGDYDEDGTNDTRSNSWADRNDGPNPAWRDGLAAFVGRMRTGAGYTSFKAIANGDGDFTDDATWGNAAVSTTELSGVYDYCFLEALTSNVGNDGASPAAYRGQFKDVLSRIYSADDNVNEGAIVGAYVMSTADTSARTLQKARFARCVALLADCYVAVSDRLGGSAAMRPYWFPELDVDVGTPVDSRPAADNLGSTGFDGMAKREYTNALPIVNSSSNKGRWMANAGGTLTLVRASNVVTLTWSAMPAGLIAAITNGVTQIRIQDCDTNATFDGVFTISGHTSTSITWAQTGSNASHSKPLGYFGIKSSVDLTGDGWVYQDGTPATVVSLFPNDAELLKKPDTDT